MKKFVYKNTINNFEVEIEASSQEEAHQIFLKQYPSVAIARYGENKPIHAILDWTFKEKN